jgi:pSer/pThr/pTyr-binding forkhead associated (FHA) protein
MQDPIRGMMRSRQPPKDTQKTQVWHVLVVDDDMGRRAIALDGVTFSIGRDLSNSIVLNSLAVSRQHALLLRVPKPDGGFFFRLFDGNSQGQRSTNGLIVNGATVHSHDLQDGDHIVFGTRVSAHYYIREFTSEEFDRYLQSATYRSVKSDVVDRRMTSRYSIEEAANSKTIFYDDEESIPLEETTVLTNTFTQKQEKKPTQQDSFLQRFWVWLKKILFTKVSP